MRTELVVQDDAAQIVLTPETEHEGRVMEAILERPFSGPAFASSVAQATVFRGSYYNCVGGWYRQGGGDESVIVRFESKKAGHPAQLETERGA